MKSYSLALYDAFTATAFGGSQAAIVTQASTLETSTRQRVARELGMPATAFVDDYAADWIEVQFMSTVMELPMCGHGTICLLTHMLDSGLIVLDGDAPRQLELRLPAATAVVSLSRRDDQRFLVMLDIAPPEFIPPPPIDELFDLLALDVDALASDLPVETARGDFIHLLVPLTGLDAMRAIRPDFSAMTRYCRAYGIETIAFFCTEVENPHNQVHLRDFCPAVGVSESAAAGTTNAAVSSYLVRHRVLPTDAEVVTCHAEQGIELGRPSSIQSRMTFAGAEITRLQVGGVATRVMDGHVYL